MTDMSVEKALAKSCYYKWPKMNMKFSVICGVHKEAAAIHRKVSYVKNIFYLNGWQGIM